MTLLEKAKALECESGAQQDFCFDVPDDWTCDTCCKALEMFPALVAALERAMTVIHSRAAQDEGGNERAFLHAIERAGGEER